MARATFATQANALLRKNLTYQRRNKCANVMFIVFPVLFCVLLRFFQTRIDALSRKPDFRCGCNPKNKTDCGIQYSDGLQLGFCAVRHPPKLPGLMHIPYPENRAVRTDFMPYFDLPDKSCRATDSCPASILLTGMNQSLVQGLGAQMLISPPWNESDPLGSLSNHFVGSEMDNSDYRDVGFSAGLYCLQQNCRNSSTLKLFYGLQYDDLICAKGRFLWRNTSSEINEELFRGDPRGNSRQMVNEFVAAYDFLNTNRKAFNVSVWYDKSPSSDSSIGDSVARLFPPPVTRPKTRVGRSVNLASNAYLQYFKGNDTRSQFEFVKDMPKQETRWMIDLSSSLSPQFFTFVIMALFPTILTFLVYEYQSKIRIMMKMHGLGDGPYWLISYGYFLTISTIYIFCLVAFGSLLGLHIFEYNSFSIQFVFYFLYINLQIALAFLLAPFFSSIRTARVVAYLVVFTSGLTGEIFFKSCVEDASLSRKWIKLMEIFPGFSLYRGLYEFGYYSATAQLVGNSGMAWEDLSDPSNGMKEVLIIMFVEWKFVLSIAYFLDQAIFSGGCMKIFNIFRKKKSGPSLPKPSQQESGPNPTQTEKMDVKHERMKVERLLSQGGSNDAIVCDNLAKVYPGLDGNPPKAAVKGLSLALPFGECFGMLGPNGAGKTSFISMMIGLTKPTSGRAFIDGKDIWTQMNEVYSNMGVCPQHDLLWDCLTGREHLMFYGRLKNLTGSTLKQAVEESLRSVNLVNDGAADKFAGKYSGGMKRRLSVAISLIGDPKVVFMDEPSTGLDPASRRSLWNIVKRVKQGRAIVLTTHSMEEADVLCDRLGIFVDGSLQCIGNSQELKARYGGSFVLTVTTSANHDADVERMAQRLSPNAHKIYHISGTQKFELPKQEVRVSDVFREVQNAKRRFLISAWGVADTTLEDVFIKVARGAEAFGTLS